MDTLFPTSSPTLKPTSYYSFHPDTQKGAIISFIVLGSGIIIIILIIYFFCRKNVIHNHKLIKNKIIKDNTGSTNLPYDSSQI